MTQIDKLKIPPHIEILRSELQRRQDTNPRYSLRGFADYLNMHPSALSRILQGKQQLSLDSAVFLLRKMKMKDPERLIFVSSLAQEKLAHICARLSEAMDDSTLDIETLVIASLKTRTDVVRNHELVDFLTTPCWQIDTVGTIIKFNESFRAEFRMNRAEGNHFLELIHVEDRESYLALWDRATNTGTSFQHSSRLKGADGEYVILSLQTMPLKNTSHEVIGWLCIVDPQSTVLAQSGKTTVG